MVEISSLCINLRMEKNPGIMNMIYIDLRRIKEATAINVWPSYCHDLALCHDDSEEIKEKR